MNCLSLSELQDNLNHCKHCLKTCSQLKDPKCGPLDVNFFKRSASVAKSPVFSNMREVCGRHKLTPGNYVIVPSTFQPNEEADFMLRLYTEKAVTAAYVEIFALHVFLYDLESFILIIYVWFS